MINNYYEGKYRLAVQDLYPDYEFLPWLFGHQRGTWSDPEIRLRYLEWLARPEQLNIREESDWYRVNQELLMEKGLCGGFWRRGSSFSVPQCLIEGLPDLKLRRWKFTGGVPCEYWESFKNRRLFVDDFLDKYNIASGVELQGLAEERLDRDALGRVVSRQYLRRMIQDEGGEGYLVFHEYSISAICQEFFPDHDWGMVRFFSEPSGFSASRELQIERHPRYWHSRENRLKYVNVDLRESLSITSPEDWYEVSRDQICSCNGSGLLKYYNSHIELLVDLVQDAALVKWLFARKPDGFWDSDSVKREFLQWFYEASGFSSLADFYKVTRSEIERGCQAWSLFSRHKDMPSLLAAVFPEFPWEKSLFLQLRGEVESLEFREMMLSSIEEELNISSVDEWYLHSTLTVRSTRQGSRLLKYYGGSMISMLDELRPAAWQPWRFGRVSREYWSQMESRRTALDWLLAEKLKIHSCDGHKVTHQDLEASGLISLLNYHGGSLLKAFTDLYPENSYDPGLFAKTGKNEVRLYESLKRLLPSMDMRWGHFYEELRFSGTNRPMQLDIFFPDLKFAIEYQGEQHYRPAWGGYEELVNIQRRDQEKRDACAMAGIELLEIRDLLWDGSDELLVEFLRGTSVGKLV